MKGTQIPTAVTPATLNGPVHLGRATLEEDLCSYHEVVGQNPQPSFKTGFWFWMKNCHDAIVSGKGFGATIRAITSLECKVENRAKAEDRVSKYRKFCSDFGVDPGLNIFC
ncbi:chitinase 5-like protein [Cinnamomum micranthum f. kanehirae]|uniref:Chitinase 5-like protein n=1 Tax=Cinnamomum micranthum f. kanehirae TaxID=337451 RepID=A0A3S3MP46_9MAGN|nr:chitinase 5-like protein [Cinnamomum micranthum f. kanehirae]